MEPNHKPETDTHLKEVLGEWVLDTPLPPRFQDQVWQRIARAEAQNETTVWPGLGRLVEILLPRPKIALSYMASLLILGIAAGSFTAQLRSNHLDADLRARYVQSLDPYQMTSLRP